jgi:hypothetical protein
MATLCHAPMSLHPSSLSFENPFSRPFFISDNPAIIMGQTMSQGALPDPPENFPYFTITLSGIETFDSIYLNYCPEK